MPITITITADTLTEALALLKCHSDALEAPQRIQTITQEVKTIVKEVEAIQSVTEAPKTAFASPETAPKVESAPTKTQESAPSSQPKGPDLSDIVAFRTEIKRISMPLMTDEEKALQPKEGEMALVKRLFGASGVKNSHSVEGSKRQAFLDAIPSWIK